ncbi:MAG: DUF3592 domain-containing protein [Clostridia bacterium]|nr:DUF3592 domain-containing protein [Clostridia bacterium]
MFSAGGPKLKIFAGILALIVLIVGVYMTFFQSRGFVKTTAVITDVRMDSTGESTVYYPTVEYTVNGKTYTAELDTASSSYRSGQAISVLYDPGNPSVVHDGSGFGLYLMIAGAVILAVVVFSAIREKQSGGST